MCWKHDKFDKFELFRQAFNCNASLVSLFKSGLYKKWSQTGKSCEPAIEHLCYWTNKSDSWGTSQKFSGLISLIQDLELTSWCQIPQLSFNVSLWALIDTVYDGHNVMAS